MDALNWLLPDLSSTQWLAHSLVFLANISLFIFARPIVNLIDTNRQNATKVSIFRALNLLVLTLHVFDLAFLKISGNYERYFIKLGLTLMSVYAGMFIYSLCCFWCRKRFGSEKEMDGVKT